MFKFNKIEKNKQQQQHKPKFICGECGNSNGFRTIRYSEGDYDLECKSCGSTDVCEH